MRLPSILLLPAIGVNLGTIVNPDDLHANLAKIDAPRKSIAVLPARRQADDHPVPSTFVEHYLPW
jgi:hypothetical protein